MSISKKKTEWLVISIILPLILLYCLGLFRIMSLNRFATVAESEDGAWDLRGVDFSKECVQIGGEVEYIPNALLTPKEYAAREGEAVLLDRAFPEQYGTSRLRIYVPDDGWYVLTRASIDYSTRLYVNGEFMTEIGSPGDSAETTVPNIERILVKVRAVDGVIELVQQSANFVHRAGGYHGGWYIGGIWLTQRVEAADFAIVLEMGAYLTLFVIYLLLFLMLPTYRTNLYFALYCFAWFLRMGATGHSIFAALLPRLDWYTKIRMEYIVVPIAMILILSMIREMFPAMLHKAVIHALYAIAVLFVLLALSLDSYSMSIAGPVFLWICVAASLYCIARFVLKLRSLRLDQGIFLAGLALFVCAAVRDIVLYIRIVLHLSLLYEETTQIAVLACSFFAAVAFFIATMRELAEARAAEQRLAMENAALDQVNRLKSDLIATFSHELRTPLTVMSGYAQLTIKQIEEGNIDGDTRGNLSTISREAQRLADLAGGIMRATSPDAARRGVIGVVDIFERVCSVCHPMLSKNDNHLETRIEEDLSPVRVNADMIQQVLLNLIFNANRHTRGGTISLLAHPAGEGGFVEITVCDNGGGIDPKLLPHVFEPRVSGGNSSGMGLVVCKQIIEAHGGAIAIDSDVGGGTRVRFTLPEAEGDGADETDHPDD